MNYTEKQRETIEKMVREFSKVHNEKKRMELLGWYDLASGIKNNEVTSSIMEDLGAV